MTETSTAATFSTLENHRFGTVGRALPGRRAQDRRRRRDPRSKARTSSTATTTRPSTSFGARRGRLAAHRRPRLARRGRLPVDHRAQEGHHHHRRRQEPDAGQHRERPQAVPLDLPGRDARRPAPLPGGADHARRGRDARSSRASTACPRTSPRSRASPAVHELIQARDRPRERQIRAGRAGQEVRDPRPRPVPADRRADADAEGQAQHRQREVRGHVRRAVRQLTGTGAPSAANIWQAMRTDPSENGGLFVGRRPGTAPVRFRALPKRGSEMRQRDRRLARRRPARGDDAAVPAVLGADPARLPVARARRPTTSRAASASASSSSFVGAVRAAVRRARADEAPRQRRGSSCAAPPATTSAPGVLGRIFAATAVVCALVFLLWFLVIHGPGTSLVVAAAEARERRPPARVADTAAVAPGGAARRGHSHGPARLLPPVRRDVRGGGQRGPARGGGRAQAQSARRASRRSTSRTRPGRSCPTRASSARSRSSPAAACTATRTSRGSELRDAPGRAPRRRPRAG